MCLYPQLIINRKYTANKKNEGKIPPLKDERIKYVPIGCGDCMECRKKKAREWQVRLQEEIKTRTNGKFITLTISNEKYYEICNNTKNLQELKHIQSLEGYQKDNAIAIATIRLFTERWRKKYGKTIRHWLITELGHNGTENIHLHGILWTNETYTTIQNIWQYGHIWPTQQQAHTTWVNNQTINYMIKYVTKQDEIHTLYKPVILTSQGIGANYTNTANAKTNLYARHNGNTIETYRTNSGHKIALPIYYRNKIYTEEQREQLWLNKLDKGLRWICGEKVNIKNGEEEYYKLLKWHQTRNRKLGYGDGQKTWNQKEYETQRRNMMNEKRLQNVKRKWERQRREELLSRGQ